MNVSDNLLEDINDGTVVYDEEAYRNEEEVEKLPIVKGIRMEHVSFRYPGSEAVIFDDASLFIPAGKSVGIVGTSGAGKTTVVDIMLGLLAPERGVVYADDVVVGGSLSGESAGTGEMLSKVSPVTYRSFLKNIGYIPQTIFMLDSTIRKNVAFGTPDERIEDDKVWAALKEAQLDEYVRSLPEGLDTSIGERGIRLSGGQRQRIGIARALYEDPEVMVLDEATSALDNETEAAIMDSINRLHGRKTLIIIAHRLQTIEKCDIVYRIGEGKVFPERGEEYV